MKIEPKRNKDTKTRFDPYNPLVERDGKMRKVGRVIGGLGWPSKTPGYLVVIAEEKDPILTNRTIYYHHLLAEFESYDLFELAQRAFELSVEYGIDAFVAAESPEDEAYLWNLKNQGFHVPRITRSGVISDGTIKQLMRIIKDETRPPQESLYGLKTSPIRVVLLSMDDEMGVSGDEKLFPSVSALGHAIGALKMFPPPGDAEYYAERKLAVGSGRDRMTGY